MVYCSQAFAIFNISTFLVDIYGKEGASRSDFLLYQVLLEMNLFFTSTPFSVKVAVDLTNKIAAIKNILKIDSFDVMQTNFFAFTYNV